MGYLYGHCLPHLRYSFTVAHVIRDGKITRKNQVPGAIQVFDFIRPDHVSGTAGELPAFLSWFNTQGHTAIQLNECPETAAASANRQELDRRHSQLHRLRAETKKGSAQNRISLLNAIVFFDRCFPAGAITRESVDQVVDNCFQIGF